MKESGYRGMMNCSSFCCWDCGNICRRVIIIPNS